MSDAGSESIASDMDDSYSIEDEDSHSIEEYGQPEYMQNTLNIPMHLLSWEEVACLDPFRWVSNYLIVAKLKAQLNSKYKDINFYFVRKIMM